jgi:membrane protein implicated in regulation of membrane protease activity
MMALAIVGGAAIAVGVVALLARQPYAVVFPMLLLGTILVAVFGGGYRAVRRGYEAAELRKMRALDAAGV